MFQLDTWTNAKVLHINKRVELHGQEPVHAKDINWSIEVPNTALDAWFGPELRNALYRAKDTATLDGIDPTTPDLRTELLKAPFKVKREFAGYMLTIKRQNGRKNIELASCDLNNFRLDPKPGGTCGLLFRSQVSGLEGDILGRIDEIDGHEVEVLMLPPALQEGTLPESAAANPFKFTGTGDGVVDNSPAPEAGDIFASEHAPDPDPLDKTDLPRPPAKKTSAFKSRAQAALKAAAKKAAANKTQGHAVRP